MREASVSERLSAHDCQSTSACLLRMSCTTSTPRMHNLALERHTQMRPCGPRLRSNIVDTAIIGALAALLGVLLGQFVGSRSESRKWLRDQSFTASVDFLRAVDRFRYGPDRAAASLSAGTKQSAAAIEQHMAEIQRHHEEMQTAGNRAILVCRPGIYPPVIALLGTANRLLAPDDTDDLGRLFERFDRAKGDFIAVAANEFRPLRRLFRLRSSWRGEKALARSASETAG